MQVLTIWQPRYKDNTVLLAKYKVPDEDFKIVFTRANHLAKQVFKANGRYIKDNFPIESNGKIDCYVVPLSFLDNITITSDRPDDYIPTIET